MGKLKAAQRRKKLAIVLKKIGWTFSDLLRSAQSTAMADANCDKRLESPLERLVFHISEAVKVVIKVPRPPAPRIKNGPGITVIPTDGDEHQFAYDFARIETHFRRAETLWAQFSQVWPQSPAVEFGRYIHNSAVAAAFRFCEQNWSARVRARLANPPAGPVGEPTWNELVNQNWTELSEAEVGQWRARYYKHWDVSNPFGKSAISQNKILRAWRILETHMRYELGLMKAQITSTASEQKPAVVLPNDERNKWLYGQFCKIERGSLVPKSKVVSRLRKKCSKLNWSVTKDVSTLTRDVNKWAARNGKPPIPPRQRAQQTRSAN